MDRWSGKVVVVTGASHGIGEAISQALVRAGLIVVGLTRRRLKMEGRMKNIDATGKFYARECDIANPQDVSDSFEWIKKNIGTVHILINNAGAGRPGTIENTEVKDLQSVINVNLMGVLYCTKQAIKLMKENNAECHIININSLAGHRAVRLAGKSLNVYSATNHALKSISETLAHELHGSKVRVCNLSLGLVNSEILEKPDDEIRELPLLDPEDVTNSILYIVGAPPHVVISELTIQPLGERP